MDHGYPIEFERMHHISCGTQKCFHIHPPLHPISRVVTVTWRQHIDFEGFCQRNTFATIRGTPLEGLRSAFAIHRITLPHWFVPFFPTLGEPGNLAIGNCFSNSQLLAKPFIDGGQVLKFHEEL